MLKLFINNTDASNYLDEGSLSISNEIQNKADTCRFSLRPGVSEPEENQEVMIYDTVKLVSANGVNLIVKDSLQSGMSILDYGKFRANQYIWLGVGLSTQEKVQISAIAAGTTGQVNITLVKAIKSAHSINENVGKLIFGGTLTYVRQSNPKLLNQIEYSVTATDFTKIFDKKIINDSWEDKNAQYIINDFCNTTINYNRELDDMDYANDAAAQAVWTASGVGNSPTIDTVGHVQGTSRVILSYTV